MLKNNFCIKVLQFSCFVSLIVACSHNSDVLKQSKDSQPVRERILFNDDWRFFKYESVTQADDLIYDVRPDVTDRNDDKPADAQPQLAAKFESNKPVLKPWILPTANPFISGANNKHTRPTGNPGGDFAFVQHKFDDNNWEKIQLPHDWAIAGPFYAGEQAEVGGGMGRLPSPGVAWYRKSFDVPETDKGKSIFLEVEGAMSYAMVWLNGNLVGGWPYGYASWQLNLTPYINPGQKNQLAIRLDNPPDSARWYPGGGLYRDVWLIKTQPIHIAQWGTYITTPSVSKESATVNVAVTIENDFGADSTVTATTNILQLNQEGKTTNIEHQETNKVVGTIEYKPISIGKSEITTVSGSIEIKQPLLWGPPPNQTPHLYLAVTEIKLGDRIIDRYQTRFGIRKLLFDPDTGVLVNGEHVYLQGVNQHHDLGALGGAFNRRAAERQLEILREMGVNAIRMAHNPPASGLLQLTDEMGFLVVNEIFDVWERKKTPLDFHLIFSEWHEADLRAFIRRDRNHPSVIMWSIGNEVGEQYTEQAGAELALQLHNIAKQEDPTRPTTASMNFAKPPMPFPAVMDAISLNYQGEGIRNAPAYAGLKGITTHPLYPSFHQAHPDKIIFSSENAAALSSRGEYLFPVTNEVSAPVKDGEGGDPVSQQVSAYELYTAPFGSSADKVLASLDKHSYVAGGFIWSGWDYLGEPTPYYGARSSYYGVIDLAGFKKDRFYLYQSKWRPELPMVHILPHWNWPERNGQVTPVHVFTSGDEAELFLNGKSLGVKQKQPYQYRLRWDNVVYEPGQLEVVAYKNSKKWAQQTVVTTGMPAQINLQPDRSEIRADGLDLSFITVQIQDQQGRMVPTADSELKFSISGPGKIVATDNGDPTNLVSFKSTRRRAFNGLCLVVVQSKKAQKGKITVKASSNGLKDSSITIHSS